MRDRFPVYEVLVKRCGRGWRWTVCTIDGALIMTGSGSSRPAANYDANRALFLLLQSAPHHSRTSCGSKDSLTK